ncbi:glycosyltransferase family 39 protein [Novilysobacter spongiicola]|uniref:Dolichyl-phosphate-mannose-protein mannosyltransferase n=1 Tax=Lysobacter spongiicola DSM 21749 TaxID=1122188 RepID=A0A1T4S823_9GAMM|nr:glycosyltransferase family 39 protein [Lysobacter spongiicola]SKA24048.1 Dolichyl-phosphate-mannose-protein mannosyltransferase [Lysobacter spongiicola DSM 21749]
MSKRFVQDGWLLAAVGMVFLLVGGYYFTGLYCSDDTRYMLGAIRLAVGEPISTASLAERRVMFLLPAALFHAFGWKADLLAAPYLLFFVGTGCSGYLLARRLLPRAGAALAMLLAAAQPVLFLYAGAMLPDIAGTFFIVLALLLLVLWLEAVEVGAGWRRELLLAAGVGGAMATSLTIKESGLVLLVVPVVVIALASWRRGASRILPVITALLLGFAAVLVVEAAVFRLTAGHWYSSLLSLSTPHDMQAYTQAQGLDPIARLGTLRAILSPVTKGLFLLAGLSSLHLARAWHSGRLPHTGALGWLVVVFGWSWPLLAFTLGSVSLTEYRPAVMQERYYAPAIIPAAILAADLVRHIAFAGAARFRWVGPIAAAVLSVWLLSAPYSMWADRGLIYAAGAKEAFLLARRDAARRFPGVPLYDVASGWNADLGRCRALLVPVLPGGEERLSGALAEGADRKGRFFQPEARDLIPPYLVLGHGPFLDEPKRKDWSRNLLQMKREGKLSVEQVGRYCPAKLGSSIEQTWMPRSIASQRTNVSAASQCGAGELRHHEPQYVDLYLVTESRR